MGLGVATLMPGMARARMIGNFNVDGAIEYEYEPSRVDAPK
ncbi:hypothetical protein BTZ20_0778 [Rhodococcus sp. MTM3W5.2]|nr:hypothetical protein BTZ20_0778 [Rhodococcus sp. MTM3W5.2]